MGKKKSRKRRRPRIRRRTPPGGSPGTVKVAKDAPTPVIHVIAFGPDKVVEEKIENLERLSNFVGKWPVTWINVEGLGDADTIMDLGAMFGLHRLALEDVVNVHQRAKVEEYDDHVFIVARMISGDAHLATEQISLFLGKDFVLTFQERPNDCFQPIQERIRQKKSHIHTAGPDYLAYRLLDAAVDAYFPALEQYGDHLDQMDDEVTARATPAAFSQIHDVKADLLLLRRAVWPHREAINKLVRDKHPLISDETRIYLRDVYDHVTHLVELVEAYREICADLRDHYMSNVSSRMNEVMKVLTVIATIFIPLGFIAGLYGMNFNPEKSKWNMPELGWTYGYPFALVLMASVAIGMLAFFWRRGWLGARSGEGKEPEEQNHRTSGW